MTLSASSQKLIPQVIGEAFRRGIPPRSGHARPRAGVAYGNNVRPREPHGQCAR